MSLPTDELHGTFLGPLERSVAWHSDLPEKPLLLDLEPPLPPRLQAYVYNLVEGSGISRRREYKVSLRVPGQRTGEYGALKNDPDRFNLLVGYRHDLDVFVFWDAALHPRFKAGGNIQVANDAVLEAAATGQARQYRQLRSVGQTELVLICQSSTLSETLRLRILHTGGEEA